jgi:phosphopantothenoylcysteine synthetase/decarboxylase
MGKKKALPLVGFAAETEDLLANAQQKLQRKMLTLSLQMMLLNGAGFETE